MPIEMLKAQYRLALTMVDHRAKETIENYVEALESELRELRSDYLEVGGELREKIDGAENKIADLLERVLTLERHDE